MTIEPCDLCGSSMREGQYGEARWICTNEECDKFDSSWPVKQLEKVLKPLNDEIATVSLFTNGTIEMYTARWVGDGSFTVRFEDGSEIDCYLDGDKIFPDVPEINKEIRDKMLLLIGLRNKISDVINEKRGTR
ncbi:MULTISPECIES: hypothetical protein [Paenibacillus]|uniref:hypothetical protein n=1 Tax=Paenibacillus TaxID=44249 RepID=UPI000466F779|nr:MULTISPECIES: hypothetical protein [Paenibacillus]KGP77692.1 hypothetical protein P364_0131960 [Paenibacillus sp. MAEPY2]KGP78689.1 hypothetical protein P363_0131960 [Paenibacillus sp. MAEPY1]OZQ62805.1 hypothetical protein CA599_25420 [Paenibacillus taichungensis]